MIKDNFIPPICGCSDRSGYVQVLYRCSNCGNICKHCVESCKKNKHKVRKLNTEEIGTITDWVKAFGYPN